MITAISIIVPFVNNQRTIARTIDSLLIQKLEPNVNFEIILVNNCSTDETVDIIQTKQKTTIIPITIITAKQKKSPGYARNQGLLQARGTWIALVDADDYVQQGWLQALYAVAKDGVILKSSTCMVNSKTGIPIFENQQPKTIKNQWQKIPQLTTGGMFLAKKELLAVHGWDESLLTGEDYELGYRLLIFGLTVKHVSSPVYYVTRENSVRQMLTRARKYARYDLIIYQRYFSLFPTPYFDPLKKTFEPLWFKLPVYFYTVLKRCWKIRHVFPLLMQIKKLYIYLAMFKTPSVEDLLKVSVDKDFMPMPNFYPATWNYWCKQVPQNHQFLTFDDGPSPEYTARLLDLLKHYNQKATFFLVGKRALAHPELVKRMVDEGHELANHSFNHYWFNELSYQQQEQEIEQTQQAIINIVGEEYAPRFFRAPYGKMTGNVKLILYRKKMAWANWSYSSHDWHVEANGKKMAADVIAFKKPHVLLFHDGTEPHPEFVNPNASFTREVMLEAVTLILAHAKQQGIVYSTLSNGFDKFIVQAKLQPTPKPIESSLLVL